MALIVLLVSFISIFLIIGIKLYSKLNLKELLLCSILIFCTALLLITEATSAFHILNFQLLLISWIAVSALNIFYIFSQKEKAFSFLTGIERTTTGFLKRLSTFEKIISLCVLILLALIFFQGIIYPPNNWDSLTYHLTRILNWISNQSVAHYPTHVTRELYQPPFSEFVIMHVNVLSCGDYFSNAVQFTFFLFSLIAIVSIVGQLGLGFQYQFLAVVIGACIPEVILEASSTQNDIVASFFTLASFYFATKSVKELAFRNYLFLGLSCGLAILTKGTSYIYIGAILSVFGIVVSYKWLKTKNHKYIAYSLIAAFTFLILNAGHNYRNYSLTGNMLGIDEAESQMYTNQKMTPALLISNIIKNAGLHTGPITPVNILANRAIEKLHLMAGVKLNNPETNFDNIKYSVYYPPYINHEDFAPNPVHLFLILSSFLLIGGYAIRRRKILSGMIWYLTIVALQVLLFCLYLKWQPFHTRLHIPWFMLCVPLICYAVSFSERYRKLLYTALPLILIYAFMVMLFNYTRPFITNNYTSEISINDSRNKKYYANRIPVLYEEYSTIATRVSESNSQYIGLIIKEYGKHDLEYPLFTDFFRKKVHPIHINVSNFSKTIPQNQDNIDCIVSTIVNDSIIDFNGKRFYNQSLNNKAVWLYK